MSNRRVLITGCSSGFGLAMVPAFLERGWQVIATMRRASERATVFSEEMRTYGDRLQIISLDITNSAERDALRQSLDRLDCLVHNAGYGLAGPLEETPESELRREMDTNFTAPAILTKSLLPLLRASRGRLIFISSSLGLAGFPLHSVYCASKFALEGLAESLSYELAPHGVQVALVEPGAHRTQFGANIVWVEAPKGSPYGTQTAALRRLRDRMLARQGVPPDGVVRQVIDLADARRMKFRSQAGMDAKGLYAFRKFAPTWIAQRTLQFFFHRLLGGTAG